jgi:hypothetical protein
MWDDWQKNLKDSINKEYRRLLRIWPDEVFAIVIQYDGSGDSGMHELRAHQAEDGQDVELTSEPGLTEMVDTEGFENGAWVKKKEKKTLFFGDIAISLAAAATALHAPGWENNEGGSGQVIITRTEVKVEHNTNIITTEYSEQRWEPDLTAMELLSAGLEVSDG